MRNAGRAIPLEFWVFSGMQAVTASKLQDDLGIVKDLNMQLQAQLSAAQSSASEQVRLLMAGTQRKTGNHHNVCYTCSRSMLSWVLRKVLQRFKTCEVAGAWVATIARHHNKRMLACRPHGSSPCTES